MSELKAYPIKIKVHEIEPSFWHGPVVMASINDGEVIKFRCSVVSYDLNKQGDVYNGELRLTSRDTNAIIFVKIKSNFNTPEQLKEALEGGEIIDSLPTLDLLMERRRA